MAVAGVSRGAVPWLICRDSKWTDGQKYLYHCSTPSHLCVLHVAYRGDFMGSYKNQSTAFGELMNFLLNERSQFASEEEFKRFAVAEVRKFISDLRSLNIELTMRPIYSGQPVSHHSVTLKLAR